jgi:soluble lytic murein transglycosylase-like protein
MPKTWKHMTGKNSFSEAYNPEENIKVGTKYLRWIEEYCAKKHPSWENLNSLERREIIAAAYNYGPAGLRRKKWDIKQTPKQTRNYVKKLRQFIF